MNKVPCPHCNEELTVDPHALDTELVCPKCHVILRLAKDDDEKRSLFDLRRFLRRKKIVGGLACALLVLFAFILGFGLGNGRGQANSPKHGIVQSAFGLFYAHNEIHVNDGPPEKVEKANK